MENMEEDPQQGMVLEANKNSAIINSLNADCWQLVLKYLSVAELLQSEATCKDWQKLVLEHISHRQIMVFDKDVDENTLILKNSVKAWSSFRCWVKKCGHSIHELDTTCQKFGDVVEILRDDCPNLEVLRLRSLKKKLSPTNTLHFQKLTWLTFESCYMVTDDCINQFLTKDIQELTIISNKRVTGRFLNNLKSDNMQSLVLRECRALKFPYLLSAADRLTNLTVLVLSKLNRSKIQIRNKLHLLLDKMPNLGHVGFTVYDMLSECDYEEYFAESDVFFESACRLRKLHRIAVNFEVWDQHLEALANNCKELLAVHLQCSHVTRVGLDLFTRQLGPQLYELDLSISQLTDDDVVACVYACPKLVHLDLPECLSESVVRRVAAARRDMRANLRGSKYASNEKNNLFFRLTLYCRWDFDEMEEEFKDVIDLQYSRYQGTLALQ